MKNEKNYSRFLLIILVLLPIFSMPVNAAENNFVPIREKNHDFYTQIRKTEDFDTIEKKRIDLEDIVLEVAESHDKLLKSMNIDNSSVFQTTESRKLFEQYIKAECLRLEAITDFDGTIGNDRYYKWCLIELTIQRVKSLEAIITW